MDNSKIDVLDHGYVRLEQHMGTDLTTVNAAKVSYAKKSETFGEREERLLNFLMREEHTSTLRHAALTFEVYAPLMVARQWWKYTVASTHVDEQLGWNESSRRYVTEEPTFYIPGKYFWRSKPENSKQGSGANLSPLDGEIWTDWLERHCENGEKLYREAMKQGIAAEQARLFLPAYGMYVRWWWTTSILGVVHFLRQRLEHDAQVEIQEYAKAVYGLTHPHFPVTLDSVFPEGVKNG
jgi:thymidylate synthase (FAD)